MGHDDKICLEMKSLPEKQATTLRNKQCAYCGIDLHKSTRTQDHVIGRRFVPEGKLNASWNLILNACQNCNCKKSDLEDDIAAITLLPDLDGRFPHSDMNINDDVRRRSARSISRKTHKPVRYSHVDINLKGNFGPNAGLSMNLVGPPQIDEDRAFELARLHLTALFFMQTYNKDTGKGGW